MNRGAIAVNDKMQTNVPGIYAIGDVTMKLPLAHVASHQGVIAAETIAGKETHALNLNNVPRCTYSSPQVASLGLTEAQAKEQGHEVSIGKFNFRANGKALGINEYEGFVKLIVDKKYGEILGAHLVGPEVTDLTGEFSLAKSMELTPLEFAHAVHAHPTLTEVIAEAALDSMGMPFTRRKIYAINKKFKGQIQIGKEIMTQRIAIIGGGFAGLTAAYELGKLGLSNIFVRANAGTGRTCWHISNRRHATRTRLSSLVHQRHAHRRANARAGTG